MTSLKSRLVYHWPLAIVFLSLIIFFWPIFQGKLPIPADALVGLYHPYRDYFASQYPNGIPYKNFLITDPVLQQYPWKYLAIQEMKAGRIPWWNPYTHSGMPLLANFQTGAFYPLNWLFFLFRFDTAWTIYILLQSFLGSLFVYIFLRHHTLRPLSSALASLAWVFSGFFMVWWEWGNLGHTLLWLPLSLLMIDKYAQNKKFRFILLNSLILSTSFFAGHLQVALYVILANLAYAFYRRVFWRLTISYLLFAAIVLPQLLPTLQLIKSSARDIDQSQILSRPDWFLPWQHLVQFIAPDFFGNPATLNYFGVWNYAEFVGYIGLVPLILAVFALIRWPRLLLPLIISLIFVLPTPVAKLPFLLKLPLITWAQPSRLLSLISFYLAILSGLGLETLLKTKRFKQFILILISLILASLWSIAFRLSPVSQRNLILPSIIFITFITIIFFPSKARAYLLLLVTAADLWRFATKFTPFSSKDYLYPQTPTIKFLQENLGDWRYLTTDRRLLPPNVGIIYGLKTIEGYDPLYLASYARLITQMEGGTGIAGFNRIIRPTNLDSPILNQLAVKYILSLSDINKPQFKLVFQEGQTRVYENLMVKL